VAKAAFYRSGARKLWETISELRKRGEAVVDLAVVAEELKLRGELEKVGGYEGLAAMTSKVPTVYSVRYYAEILVLLWHRRRTLELAAKLREAALDFGTREDFVEKVSGVGQPLIRLGRREATLTLKEIYASVEEEARARAEGRLDKSRWISSGIPKFDEQCKRLGSANDDGFVVFGAGSGCGKSAAMRGVARAALAEKKTVLSYSRETNTSGFVEMLVSAELGFDLDKLEWQPKDKMAEFYAECTRQREEYADKYLFCVQNEPATPLLTVEDLRDHARAFVHLHGLPHVILIDYLQVFDARDKKTGGSNREALVAYVSHTLQALQRELGCVMVVGAQLNESGLNEMRTLKTDPKTGKVIHRLPKAGDLRESQAIYHDADRVIFFYWPPQDGCGRDQSSKTTIRPEIWWYQEKRRRGGVKIVRMWFEKAFTRFAALSDADLAHAATVEAQQTGSVPRGQKVSKEQFVR
jgi:replicative DNA helicase